MADDKEAEIVPGLFTRDCLPLFDQSISGFGEIREP